MDLILGVFMSLLSSSITTPLYCHSMSQIIKLMRLQELNSLRRWRTMIPSSILTTQWTCLEWLIHNPFKTSWSKIKLIMMKREEESGKSVKQWRLKIHLTVSIIWQKISRKNLQGWKKKLEKSEKQNSTKNGTRKCLRLKSRSNNWSNNWPKPQWWDKRKRRRKEVKKRSDSNSKNQSLDSFMTFVKLC